MTMITFTGLTVTYDGSDNAVSVGPTMISLIVPNDTATFTYSILDASDGLPWVDIIANPIQVQIDGQLMEDLEASGTGDIENELGTVTSSVGTTTVLGLSLPRGAETIDWYIAIDGASLPSITTIPQWETFNNSITAIGPASGAFAEGQDILWSTFVNATVTEDDEYIGTGGRDVFDGGIGDDYFASSRGNDVYKGGVGFDQVTFRNDPSGVSVNLAKGTATDGWGNADKLVSIEILRGSMFDDTFVGKNGGQVFRGIAGDDVMNGARGVDQVRYDRDANYGGTAGVTVHLGKGTATDGFGDTDTLRNIENARGSESNDRLSGSNGKNQLQGQGGNDQLFGLAGNDKLFGENGRDKLDGGLGNDQLTGGAQADRFIFSGNFGADHVTDFQTRGKAEKIDLSGVTSIKGFIDLKNNHLSDVGGVAVIDDGAGNTITLDGHVAADFSVNDFIF